MPIKTSQSAIKTWNRCKRQYQYKYVEGLEARFGSIPLRLGSWMHSLLEAHYSGDDWKEAHGTLLKAWNTMLLEEREHYGPIPDRAYNLMGSYIYHYREDDWEVLAVEQEIEAELENGTVVSITPDLIVEEHGTIGIIDHKNNKTIPSGDARLQDFQSVVYPKIMELAGYPKPDWFMFNYIRTKAPTVPHLNQDGSMSRAKIDTDFYTLAKFVKEHDIPLTPQLKKRLGALRKINTFFHRVRLVKPNTISDRLLQELQWTAEEIHYFTELSESISDPFVRSMQHSCDWDCDFYELCMVELMGGDGKFLRKTKYRASEYARRKGLG